VSENDTLIGSGKQAVSGGGAIIGSYIATPVHWRIKDHKVNLRAQDANCRTPERPPPLPSIAISVLRFGCLFPELQYVNWRPWRCNPWLA